MKESAAFEALTISLVGKPISHVWRGHGSAVFLEIGKLSPSTIHRHDGSLGNSQGEVTLGVEWSWRIEDQRSIICGSWSEEELWELTFSRLRESRVQACRLFGTLPEVELITDTGLRFLSFSTTDGQPQWFIIDRSAEAAHSFGVEDGKLQLERAASAGQ